MQLKENELPEFKSSFGDSVIESLAAFANTNGGRILIGVDDRGNPVKGFSFGDESLQKWVNEVKNKTQPGLIPDIHVIDYKGSKIGELSVKEFTEVEEVLSFGIQVPFSLGFLSMISSAVIIFRVSAM